MTFTEKSLPNQYENFDLLSIPFDLGEEFPTGIVKPITLISKKWTLIILHTLHKFPFIGFNEIKIALNNKISSNSLAKNLQELQKFGLIEKRILNENSYRAEYSSLISGKDLYELIKSIQKITQN